MSTPAALHRLTPIGRIGRFDLLGRIAVGGMAEIYLAREAGPQAASRLLVVKRLLSHMTGEQRLIDMFIQEARLSMRLRQPSICPIYEFGEHDGSFYLAMEWVDGVSLSDVMERAFAKGALPIEIAIKIAIDVAGALHHAHAATDEEGKPLGIVHRDVTPENIMVSYDGQVKLLDFGIAKAATQLKLTQAGELKGKFGYMSPEQYQGMEVDARSDVFSLGVCLFEALTGRALFSRSSEYETVAAIVLEERVPSIRDFYPELPVELERVVRRALAKSREARYGTADELQAALSRFLAERKYIVRDVDLAVLLQRLFQEEIAAGPVLDRTPLRGDESQARLDPVERAVLDHSLDEAEEQFASAGKRKRIAVGVIAVLVVVITAVVVSLLALRQGPASASPTTPLHDPAPAVDER